MPKITTKTFLKILVLVVCTYSSLQVFLFYKDASFECRKKGPDLGCPLMQSLPRSSYSSYETTMTPSLTSRYSNHDNKSTPTPTERAEEDFLVIGIPTVRRVNADYLTQTLRELLQGLDEVEKTQVLIVVFLADFEERDNKNIKEHVTQTFPSEIKRLIQFITAPRAFYPTPFTFPTLWGHSQQRTQWRSKQCLDFAYLWNHCKTLGYPYYLHLNDDVSTSKGYLKTMKKFIEKHQNKTWSALEFGESGSIGMLYRSSDLSPLFRFVKILQWIHPADILIRQFNDIHLHGNPDWAKHDPLVFRHVGNVSSFQGEVQNLDHVATRIPVHQSFGFPDADVIAPIQEKHRHPTNKVFLVIGVPTVKRANASYLIQTLHGLVQGLEEREKREVLILIFISDVEHEAIQSVANEIKSEFPGELSSGLMRIINAPRSYYPSLENLPGLWNDKPKRARWRSKQCLDYAFLFDYSKDLGQYYVQIEDDVLTERDYLKKIKNFIDMNRRRKWSLLEFGSRGFIGMMYRSSDLAKLAKFVRAYFWVLPVDFLHRFYNEFHLYGSHRWAIYEPPVFRHIGKVSSLQGQFRKLGDIEILKRIYNDSSNPPANISTSIKAVKKYRIESTYDTLPQIFWGKDLHIGDYILIQFHKPVKVVKFVVESGGARAEQDYIGGANISRSASRDCEQYSLWRQFNDGKQLSVVSADPKGILCSCLKIEVTALRKDKNNQVRWLIIRELAVWTM